MRWAVSEDYFHQGGEAGNGRKESARLLPSVVDQLWAKITGLWRELSLLLHHHVRFTGGRPCMVNI